MTIFAQGFLEASLSLVVTPNVLSMPGQLLSRLRSHVMAAEKFVFAFALTITKAYSIVASNMHLAPWKDQQHISCFS